MTGIRLRWGSRALQGLTRMAAPGVNTKAAARTGLDSCRPHISCTHVPGWLLSCALLPELSHSGIGNGVKISSRRSPSGARTLYPACLVGMASGDACSTLLLLHTSRPLLDVSQSNPERAPREEEPEQSAICFRVDCLEPGISDREATSVSTVPNAADDRGSCGSWGTVTAAAGAVVGGGRGAALQPAFLQLVF